MSIPHDRGALKLMQRIRDEAHRFANDYNELLLRKRVKESLLDDCPGISPAKKKTLFEKVWLGGADQGSDGGSDSWTLRFFGELG